MAAFSTIATIAAATATAGAGIYSANKASSAAKAGAQASQQAADQSINEQRRQYDQTRQDQLPWLQAGTAALNQMSSELGLGGSLQQMSGQQSQYGDTGMPSYPGVQNYTGVAGYGGNGGNGMGGNGPRPDYAAYVQNNPDLISVFNSDSRAQDMGLEGFGEHHWNTMGGMNEGRGYTPNQNMATTTQAPTAPTDGPPGTPSGGPVAPQGTLTAPDKFANFRATPGYQFNFQEGQRSLDASLAKRGILDSGAAMKESMRFGAGLADNTYDRYFGRLQSLAGVGQSSAGNISSAGQNMAGNIGNTLANNAANKATSYGQQAQASAATAGALASGFGTVLGALNRPAAPSQPFVLPTYTPPTYRSSFST